MARLRNCCNLTCQCNRIKLFYKLSDFIPNHQSLFLIIKLCFKATAGDIINHIRALTNAGIAVCSHLGLTPQSVGVLGGYKVQGKDIESANKLIDDAKKVEEAGAFAILLECVPKQVAKKLSEEVSIPVIGIGAGVHVDAQVLVYHDILGYGVDRFPKFIKNYTMLDDVILDNIKSYINDVKNGDFPEEKHSYNIKEEEIKSLYGSN